MKSAVGRRHPEQGYVLLALLLVMALMAIAATVIAPDIVFEIKRDREEELVHRGVQYSRALRRYVKANGHYPNSLNDLASSSGQRWIRRLYKDPITGKDFRLLHMNDVQPGIGLGTPNQPNQNGGIGGGFGSPAQNGNAQSLNATANSGGTPAPDSAQTTQNGDPSAQPSPQQPSQQADGSATGPQPGLLIFGVASSSKAKTIREFNHKNHYNDWYFFYDPNNDRGYEIKGPTLPGGFGQAPVNLNGNQSGSQTPANQGEAQPQTPAANPPN
jgi:type II secretory pathway pseudopilin PulG